MHYSFKKCVKGSVYCKSTELISHVANQITDTFPHFGFYNISPRRLKLIALHTTVSTLKLQR
jgi:hypothetical protein